MTTVIAGDIRRAARLALADRAALVVSIGGEEHPGAEVARIDVSVASDALARRLTSAMTRALRAAVARPPRPIAVVRVRSRAALDRLGARVAGAIAVVPVTAGSVRRAAELVDALRARGAAGIQLAWDEDGPPRGAAEVRMFALLEQVRATPGRAPVVLARGHEPVDALRILVDLRR